MAFWYFADDDCRRSRQGLRKVATTTAASCEGNRPAKPPRAGAIGTYPAEACVTAISSTFIPPARGLDEIT
jgi:hypothetical protein